MAKHLRIIALIGVSYNVWNNGGWLFPPGNLHHDEVIMYSLSTCGNCIITA